MRKSWIVLLVLLVRFTAVNAQADLRVTVTGFEDGHGQLVVGLFDNARDFLKTAVDGRTVDINGDSVTVVFPALPAGSYAVSVIHDTDKDGVLDTNILGIPKEGFAFGNNAMGTFGPPSFEKARVVIDSVAAGQLLILKYF